LSIIFNLIIGQSKSTNHGTAHNNKDWKKETDKEGTHIGGDVAGCSARPIWPITRDLITEIFTYQKRKNKKKLFGK